MTIPRKKLRFKFEIAVKHLNLSKEEIDAAWVSATADPINAQAVPKLQAEAGCEACPDD
jgi:hypothetical protein